MKLATIEASFLLEKMLRHRSPFQPASIAQQAGIPTKIIIDFAECGDFRFCSDSEAIGRLLTWLKQDRDKYVRRAMIDYTNEELLREIKARLEAG